MRNNKIVIASGAEQFSKKGGDSRFSGNDVVFFLITLLIVAFSLVQCKPEKTPPPTDAGDDSLYTATPYQLPNLNPARYRAINVPADNPMTQEGVLLGRMLFYDPVVSADSTVSCASCHKPQFSFADNQPLSQRVFGVPTTRNTQALIDIGMNKKFFWDARVNTVEDAVRDAMNGEQGHNFLVTSTRLDSTRYRALFNKAFGRPGGFTEEKIVKAISQFLRTLISYNSKFDRYVLGDQSALTADEYEGYQIFLDNNRGDCFHCHIDLTYLTMANQIKMVANNALDTVGALNDFEDKGYGTTTGDLNDNGRFKIPTLRNVALTAPYMHDGRFATLEQVVNHYSDSLKYSPNVDPLMEFIHQRGSHLSPTEKQKLIAFLHALTDTAFTNNLEFQNPD